MAKFGLGLRGVQLDRLEKEANGESKPAKKDSNTSESKPKRTMTQAEFSGYDKPEKKAKGGVVGKRGWGIARCGK